MEVQNPDSRAPREQHGEGVTTAPRKRGSDPSDPPGDRQGKPLLHRSRTMAAKKKKKAKKKK
jgi:hypothetical protein